MDRTEARRRLADVVNLADNVATAVEVATRTSQRIDIAHEAVVAAEANHAKAADALAAHRTRLEEAQAALADVDPEILQEIAEELGAKRAQRARYLDALAAPGGVDVIGRHTAAVVAAARDAGAVMAYAESATAGAAGREGS